MSPAPEEWEDKKITTKGRTANDRFGHLGITPDFAKFKPRTCISNKQTVIWCYLHTDFYEESPC